MIDKAAISSHYTRGDLLRAISSGVNKLGKTPATISLEDLAPVDEFHIGGSMATRTFLDQISIEPDDHLLDIGCGLGGASRFAAKNYGCRVTGIDLTDTFVTTGNELCSWVGLNQRVNLVQGNALAMDFPANTFGKAFMLHVGMNIADKELLAREAWRVLAPGGVFGIYDVMRIGVGELIFPVPWAAEPKSSSVASPEEYKHAMSRAGFVVIKERNCRDFAIEFFERLSARAKVDQPPSPLGLHILMGEDTSTKIQNMIQNISERRVAPVELIAMKPS